VKEGGVLSQVQREINVEALPMEIPEHVDLDVSGMAIGDTLRLADLAPVEGVTYLDDPEETVLASVGLPAREVEPEPEELAEGEELPEGEVPEGEAAEGAAEGEAPVADAGSGEQPES
jgi:large subunit ribosomal protein L25